MKAFVGASLLAAVFGLGVAARALDVPGGARPLAAMALLDQYLAGRFDEVVAALSAEERLDDLLDQLRRDGHGWVDAGTDDERPRRELAAATLALEAARIGQWKHWKVTQFVQTPVGVYKITWWEAPPSLLEWGCALLRRHETPQPAERLWQLAANGVAQRGEDDEFLYGDVAFPGRYPKGMMISPTAALEHLRHLRERFPDEPRFQLAQGIAWEWLSADVHADGASIVRAGSASGDPLAATTREAVTAFDELRDDVDVGGEASMRLGVMRLRRGDVDEALALFGRAETLTRDPWVVYLARYFAGQAHERRKRPADAERAYRAALAAVPLAQSASVALGALLYRDGRRAEGSAIVEAMLAADPMPADPWRGYIDADDRFWPGLLARLRAEIRE
jgi:tetratricopeptide (TPR) repeat protein